MPELPEVETVRRGLTNALVGHCLARVEQRAPALRWPLPADFAARLRGRRVVRLDRRAKFILAYLDDDTVWLSHLGMSGRMHLIDRWPDRPGRHDHLLFQTDAGAVVVFNDVRRFGMMDLVPAAALERHRLLCDLGPEPLGNRFDALVLNQKLAGRRTPIKAALLDQKTVAGLGNIYVCEALWRAGISPRRLAHTVPGRRSERLTAAIRDVLNDAIAAGGSSLRDYVQADGELGYFQHSFSVYGREGQVCRYGHGPIRRIVQSGRSTFFCPTCQR